MRILHLEPLRYDAATRALLAQAGEVTYRECDGPAALLAAAAEAPYGALFCRLGLRIDREVLTALPDLRFLVTPTTGLDHLDLDEAGRRGIRVISLRGETDFLRAIRSTAEMTWALALALMRRLPWAFADVLGGHWRREPFLGEELDGKTLGVIGCGRLGSMVTHYGKAFGMRVLAHDNVPEHLADAAPNTVFVGLDELLAESDCVSLHLPLNPATRDFLNRGRLFAMRPGAVLINTARGELLDEVALLEALSCGHLAGAALDVLAGDSGREEGVPDRHPLVTYAHTHDNLLITPHIGGYGAVALGRTRRFIVERFLAAAGIPRQPDLAPENH